MYLTPLKLDELIKARDWDGIYALIISKLPLIVGVILVLTIGFTLSNFVGKIVVKALRAKNVDPSIHTFIKTIVVMVLKFAVILSSLSTLGVNINSFIAAISAAGVAAGLGLQGSVSQFASGIEILINKPFKSGDYVELEDVAGKVVEIKLMYTVLLTLDNKRIIVPNSHITSGVIINYTAEKRRRLDLVFSVSYSDDIEKVKKVLAETADSYEKILKAPAPIIQVLEHSESCINMTCYVWCISDDYWDVFYYMQEHVKNNFDKNGISIPFNQLDVHINKE